LVGLSLASELCPKEYVDLLKKNVRMEKITNPHAFIPEASVKGVRVFIPRKVKLSEIEVYSHDGVYARQWDTYTEIVYPNHTQGNINVRIYSKGKTYFCRVQISYSFFEKKFKVEIKEAF